MKKFDFHLHFNHDNGPDMDDYVSIMDAHDVAGGLVHAYPGDLWSDHPSSGQTDEAVLSACRKHPGRLFGSVYLDLREFTRAQHPEDRTLRRPGLQVR